MSRPSLASCLPLLAALVLPAAENVPAKPATAGSPDVAALFDKRALVKPITEIEGILTDGSKSTVYKIVVRSLPPDHQMGPWAPATLKDKGGFWEDTVDKKLYRVDADYLKMLNKRGWNMFEADGTVHRTKDRTEFDKVARQELGGWTFEQAKESGVVNSVIELKPLEQIVTIFLPKNPKATAKVTRCAKPKYRRAPASASASTVSVSSRRNPSTASPRSTTSPRSTRRAVTPASAMSTITTGLLPS